MKQNHSSSFSVVSNNIISLLSSRKKVSISESFFCNKGIMLQTLQGKQQYQVTNVGVKKNKIITFASSNVLMNLKWTKFNVKHHSNPDRLDKQ